MKYLPSEIEPKWQEVWKKKKIYSPNLDTAKKPFYNLMMFPYPSAEGMHVGNMYAFTGADIYGKLKRMQGKDVFEPIGLDGFGIHSENYAIKVGRHPKEQAEISEKNFYRQLRATGNGFDWQRTVETYDPKYYKWTQWLFIQLFKAGLAYRKKAPVNFCPSCKTVLADEQVIQNSKFKIQISKIEETVGVCERCDTPVEKRELEQWFFKITKYADRLLNGLRRIDWAEKIKIAQKQWIGRSEGARIRFRVIPNSFRDLNSKSGKMLKQVQHDKEKEIEVFTTRPDTLFGATFLVLSPEHQITKQLFSADTIASYIDISYIKRIKDYIKKIKGKSEKERVEEKEKTGVFSGLYAINPVNNEKIPIWIADYVLMGYGTGAIMAVPAHDQRDFEFAKKFKLEIKEIIKPQIAQGPASLNKAYVGEGKIINSGDWNGWKTPGSIGKVIEWLEKKELGKKEANYHLRDWLISRQRYWGPPIPMIYCEKCDWQPVPDKDLPVLLPDVKDWKPLGTGKSPLANHPEFYETKCPKCKGKARRETDVSDTFLDSAWYFLRYVSTEFNAVAFDKERVRKWLPVNMYIGGAEHAVLHLLYSRFITMVLHDLGFISFEEPFVKFYAHGLLIKEGAKMSKSKGNFVIPDDYIKKYGADTLRCYLMFIGPFVQGGDFHDNGIEGMHRFLKRVWTLVSSIKYQVLSIENKKSESADLDRFMHKTIKQLSEDLESLSYNTAIAHIMEYYNELHSFYTKYKILNTKYCKTLLLLLAPFAPHMTEELWQNLRGPVRSFPPASAPSTSSLMRAVGNPATSATPKFESVHLQPWPKFDEKYLTTDEVTIAVQVNGKVRGTIEVQNSKIKNQKEVEHFASLSANVKKHLIGKKIKKVIYVEGRIINFVA